MKVIKNGTAPILEKECTCDKCQSVLLVSIDDLRSLSGAHETVFDCPVCLNWQKAPYELDKNWPRLAARNQSKSIAAYRQNGWVWNR